MAVNLSALQLDKQLCFPLYTASRLVTQCYHPILKELDLTYPQYLVLLVLWESDKVNVSLISKRLYLQSNTLTPLLKRMEEMGLLTRERSAEDERNVIIRLTEKGRNLQIQASTVPAYLSSQTPLSQEEFQTLHQLLYKIIQHTP